MRRTTRKINLDRNHKTVVDDLRGQGVEVVEILEPVDLIVRARDGWVAFCEIKPDASDTTYRRAQLEFIAGTKCPVFITTSGTDALRKLKTRDVLSQKQKDDLAAFLLRNEGTKQWGPAPIRRVLEGVKEALK